MDDCNNILNHVLNPKSEKKQPKKKEHQIFEKNEKKRKIKKK